MLKGIKVVEVDGEKIYLKKSPIEILGWKVVYPWKNEDGSWNYFNLLTGGWPNLLTVIAVVILILSFFLAYKEVSVPLSNIVSDPQAYCRKITHFINMGGQLISE